MHGSSTLSSSFHKKSFKPRQPAGLTRIKSSKVKNSEASMVIFEA